MALTKDDVKKVAKLANLPLTSDEEDKYSQQLSKVLEYVEQLEKVDTKDIGPTFNVSGQYSVMAEDKPGSCTLPQNEVLKNASQKNEQFFTTKGVFDNE